MIKAPRRPLEPPGSPVLIQEETGWVLGSARTGFEKRKSVAPFGVSIPGRSARRESLY